MWDYFFVALVAVAVAAIQLSQISYGWIGHTVSSSFYVPCKPALKASIGLDLYGEVVPAERLFQLAKIRESAVRVEMVRCRFAGVRFDDLHCLGA